MCRNIRRRSKGWWIQKKAGRNDRTRWIVDKLAVKRLRKARAKGAGGNPETARDKTANPLRVYKQGIGKMPC